MSTTTERHTSGQLFEIAEGEDVLFKPINQVNGQHGKFLSFERFADDEDGTFPRVADYVKLVNRIDHEGASAFLRWHGGGRMRYDSGYCIVEREGKYSDKATLYFEKPVEIIVAYVNDEPVTIKADKIQGEFTYEWSWYRNSSNRRQDKVANVCEIYFDCQKFESTKD